MMNQQVKQSYNLSFDLLNSIETLNSQQRSQYDLYKNEIKKIWINHNLNFNDHPLKEIYTQQLLSLIDIIKNHTSYSPLPSHSIISSIFTHHPIPNINININMNINNSQTSSQKFSLFNFFFQGCKCFDK